MNIELRKKYFGDIIPSDRLLIDFDTEENVKEAEKQLFFDDIMWDASNVTLKRAAKPIHADTISDEYIFEEVDYTKIKPNKRLKKKDLNEIIKFISS